MSLRSNFLSAKRVRDAYFGYATSQFRRLLERGRFPDVPDNRREKHARHTMRLLWQGHTLYTTGPDPAPYFEFGQRIMSEPDAASAKALIALYETKFDQARTVLPAEANEGPLEDLLQRIRHRYLDEAISRPAWPPTPKSLGCAPSTFLRSPGTESRRDQQGFRHMGCTAESPRVWCPPWEGWADHACEVPMTYFTVWCSGIVSPVLAFRPGFDPGEELVGFAWVGGKFVVNL
ncbi:hypothetical protein ACFQZZ_25400 [Nocardia sp. GCM10030253]|uniref:hypothetical protein n=1 Tax=Nocardia sp. GCM10030253 TaxID=3273404 RepID=UPI00363FD4F7